MQNHDKTAHIRATIEEELGTYRALADLPATSLEEIASGLTRALSPFFGLAQEDQAESRAA